MKKLMAAALLACAVSGEEGAVFPWKTDLAAARAEASKTGQPLLIVFRCER